jgi:hypothetical protein
MRMFSQIKSVFLHLNYPSQYRTDQHGTGVPFPKNFRDTVRTIVRRLFRVYAHIYSNHFDHICALGIEGRSYRSV